MKDVAPHNVINTKSDHSALCIWAQGSLCPDGWEEGEEGLIWVHGCLGPQELWAFSKALQQLGPVLKCFQPTAREEI